MARSKKGNQKNKSTKLVTSFLILAALMIISGTYLAYLSKPQNYFSVVLDKTINYIDSLGNYNTTGTTKNYSVNSTIKLNVEDKKIQNSLLPEDETNKKIINNLNSTTTEFSLIHDSNNKKMFMSLNSNLLEKELVNTKYLIENSTEYYYVNGILPDYINNGNSNYFESLTETTTDKDNLIYLLKYISKNLKKSIKDEYINVTKEQVEINNENKSLNKISLELNDKNTKDILNTIIKQFKDDTTAKRIIGSYCEDFDKYKINDKTKILKSDEVITINIYTNIIGKIEKYEIIYKDKKEQRKISYLVPIKEMLIIENDEITYKILTEEDGSKKLFNIYNNTNQEQGKLIFDKTDKRTTISLNLKDKEKIIDVIYDSKIDNIKRKKSFDNNINITYKAITTDDNITTTNISIENKVSSKCEIKEDTAKATFASSVTEQQQLELNEKVNNVITKLMS